MPEKRLWMKACVVLCVFCMPAHAHMRHTANMHMQNENPLLPAYNMLKLQSLGFLNPLHHTCTNEPVKRCNIATLPNNLFLLNMQQKAGRRFKIPLTLILCERAWDIAQYLSPKQRDIADWPQYGVAHAQYGPSLEERYHGEENRNH